MVFLPAQKLYPVWYEHLSDIWLSTLEIGAAQLRFVTPLLRNRDEITVFMFEQKPYPVWLSCMRKSYPV